MRHNDGEFEGMFEHLPLLPAAASGSGGEKDLSDSVM